MVLLPGKTELQMFLTSYPTLDTLTLPLIYNVARDRFADTAREIFAFNLLSGEFETLETLLRGNTHNGHQISAF